MRHTASSTFALLLLFLAPACSGMIGSPTPAPSRLDSLPTGSPKADPESDLYPPRSKSDEYTDPAPLPYPINTAGAEDSAFVMPDGNTLYFWFTPDPNIPAERQLNDGVTGIYVSCKDGGLWTTPNRVILNDPKQLALDGCEFVLDDTMWFCTTRAGYVGLHWFTAELISGAWTNWKVADFEPEYQVGELHRTGDGKELYFHSSRPGGYWEFDISVSTNADGHWQPPVNLEVVNTPNPDGWPFISADGSELWFTRIMGSPTIWRSVRTDGQWSRPQEIFAPFAAEASVDVYGSIYLAHHFFTESGMLEADIYVAHRRAD